MALPLISGIDKLGRAYYKIKGKSVTRDAYMRESRRGPDGRFRAAPGIQDSLNQRRLGAYLTEEFGGPPVQGGDWVTLVQQSSERFADILASQNAL